jgi:hypothetical protein
MNLFKKIFKGGQPHVPTFHHPELGKLIYSSSDGTWATDNEEKAIYHGGIRGSIVAPDESSIQEILSRLKGIEQYWDKCSDDLQKILESWDSFPKGVPLKQLLDIKALSLYDGYWEVCFQTKPQYKWVYIGMQFEGDELISNTIDT